jgi:hypothetical protein
MMRQILHVLARCALNCVMTAAAKRMNFRFWHIAEQETSIRLNLGTVEVVDYHDLFCFSGTCISDSPPSVPKHYIPFDAV